MNNEDPNGYCITCKKPQPRVQLCSSCAGRRTGAQQISDVEVKPPQVNTLYKEEKRQERLKKS